MLRLPFAQIDAFANGPFTGNPAGVIPLDQWLPVPLMQSIAAENNLAETAFFAPDETGVADYLLRWFTPTLEIGLCGHATLASGHYLLSRAPDKDRVTFRTMKAGVLEVRRNAGGLSVALPVIAMQPAQDDAAVAALGKLPVEVWSDGVHRTLFLYENESDVRALDPDLRRLGMLSDYAYIVTAPGEGHDFVSRVFVPGSGVDEDPVTGSAHAALTPFWADRLGKSDLSAFQASPRGGELSCRLEEERVWLSGGCVTVIEGEFILPD